jgi:hypothetical protein
VDKLIQRYEGVCDSVGRGNNRRGFLLSTGALLASLGLSSRGLLAQVSNGGANDLPYGPLSAYGYMHTALVDIPRDMRSVLVPFFAAHSQFTADLQKRTGQLFEVVSGYPRPRGANFMIFKEDVSPVEDPTRFGVMRGRPGGGPPEEWKQKYPYVTQSLLPGHVVPMFSFLEGLGPKVFPTGYTVDSKLTGLRQKWGLGGKYRYMIVYEVPKGEIEAEFATRFVKSAEAVVNTGHLSAQPFKFFVSRAFGERLVNGKKIPGLVDMNGSEWSWGRYVMCIETNLPKPVVIPSELAERNGLPIGRHDRLVVLRAVEPKRFWDGVI